MLGHTCDLLIQGIEIVIIHKGERPSFVRELAEDILEMIMVFSARLYGSRSKKNRKSMETLQSEADRIGEEFGIYCASRSQDQAES
jgi:predicted site-specific integrase-resolvase